MTSDARRSENLSARLLRPAAAAVILTTALVAMLLVAPAGADDGQPVAVSPKPANVGREVMLPLPRAGDIVWTRIAARSKPAKTAPAVTVLDQFRPDYRRQIVLALARYTDRRGKTWYKIVIPGRPNGRRGWVAAEGVQLRPVFREIRIDRSARRLELWEGKKILVRTKIAVGAPGAETPLGTYYVTWKFTPDTPILGAYAFETSAYSNLSDWPGGGIVGIHGTPWPWLLGQAVSHGCIRVHNRVIVKLRELVHIGTVIRISA